MPCVIVSSIRCATGPKPSGRRVGIPCLSTTTSAKLVYRESNLGTPCRYIPSSTSLWLTTDGYIEYEQSVVVTQFIEVLISYSTIFEDAVVVYLLIYNQPKIKHMI